MRGLTLCWAGILAIGAGGICFVTGAWGAVGALEALGAIAFYIGRVI